MDDLTNEPAQFRPLAGWPVDAVHRTVRVLEAIHPGVRGVRRACVVLAASSAVGAAIIAVGIALAGQRNHVGLGVVIALLLSVPSVILLWFRRGLQDVLELAGQLRRLPASVEVKDRLEGLRQSVQRRKVHVLGLVLAVLSLRKAIGEVRHLTGVVAALNPWQILWTILATLAALGIVVAGLVTALILVVT